MIPYGRQEIDSEDVEAVLKTLRSDWLTQGPTVPKFEQLIGNYCRAKHAIATNSATSALHIACLALGVKKGDKIWTSPISFVASANCALYCGADVDFVDVNPITYNLCPELLEEKLIQAKKSGDLPRVLIPVHLAGQSCDMKSIHSLSLKYGFKIIEDASHATGGRYDGDPVGSCKYSDIAVFSFHPVKIITSGEGGMAVTNSQQVMLRMASLRSHGITRDPDLMTIEPDGAWFYQQLELGFNYRMTDIQAALGLSQLARLDTFVEQRHSIADTYFDKLESEGIVPPFQHRDSYSSFHLFILNFTDLSGPQSRNEVFNRLRESGVNVNLHYIPIYRHPYYSAMGFDHSCYPEAEAYYQRAVSIPMYPNMTADEQDFVIDVIKSDTVKTFKIPSGYQDLF